MGWLAKLFGLQPRLPARRSVLQTGFFWNSSEHPALAAGRGFTQNVVGESHYYRELEALAGGPTIYGVKVDLPALLVADTWEGAPCVTVQIQGAKVGSIPASEAVMLHNELLAVSSCGKVAAKGRIEAGFEGGDYCVKLSLARPLRARTS